MSRGEITPIASSEDEPIEWFAQTASRWAIRCHVAASWRAGAGYLIAPWRVAVTPAAMRQETTADCPATEHWHALMPDDVDFPVDCDCYRIECDRFYLDCDPEHPDAIALWRCEPRPAPAWLMRLRRWQARIGARRRGRAVLWGGRVEREATCLDRWLFGGGTYGQLKGDRYHRIGESELRRCVVCAATTPHIPRYGDRGLICCGVRHNSTMALYDPRYTTWGRR